MIRTTSTVLILLFFGNVHFAQTYVVSGNVSNAATKETIPICNVYFSGSTIGTMTDADGNFEIKNVQPGTYDLVVSHINYDFQSFPIKITDQDIEIGNVRLKEKEIEESYAEVKDKIDRKWRRQFTRFKKYILGKNYREKDIEIPNSYVAEFQEVQGALVKKDPFTLEIRNKYTGYTIYYPVQEFLLASGTEQFMVGFPRFEFMDTDDSTQEALWIKNREKAYNGSLRHFLGSLVNNSFEENRFKVEITNVSPLVSQDDQMATNNYTMRLEPDIMPDKFLIEGTKNEQIKKITFSGFLKMTYYGEVGSRGGGQSTYIEAPQGSIYVFTNGIIVDPTSIIVYGYLASEGLYEMLPFDYELSEEIK
jgi:CarboxypepD_reg-like domain